MRWLKLTKLTVLIILQYINIWNHYAVHLGLKQYANYISIKLGKVPNTIEHELFLIQTKREKLGYSDHYSAIHDYKGCQS